MFLLPSSLFGSVLCGPVHNVLASAPWSSHQRHHVTSPQCCNLWTVLNQNCDLNFSPSVSRVFSAGTQPCTSTIFSLSQIRNGSIPFWYLNPVNLDLDIPSLATLEPYVICASHKRPQKFQMILSALCYF